MDDMDMMDKELDRVLIRDLQLRCIVGVFPQERTEKQDIVINIVMHGDLRRACDSDSLEDTIDYKSVKKRILAMAEGSDFFLIERLAGRIAEICLDTPYVEKVEVTVDKPGALRFARSASVTITRERRSGKTAYIGLCSNMDAERHVLLALELLAARTRVTGVSRFCWTEPIAHPEQDRYLNGVARVETALPVRELKYGVLRDIEQLLGRVRTEDAYAPRTIDLDVLLYGFDVIDEDGLRVPDADIRERSFVAAALAELDGGLVLPDTGERVADLACIEQQGWEIVNEEFTGKVKKRFGE